MDPRRRFQVGPLSIGFFQQEERLVAISAGGGGTGGSFRCLRGGVFIVVLDKHVIGITRGRHNSRLGKRFNTYPFAGVNSENAPIKLVVISVTQVGLAPGELKTRCRTFTMLFDFRVNRPISPHPPRMGP